MKVTTKIQAERIARTGAAKMTAQGYSYKQSAANPSVFRVVRPDGGFYFVQVEGPGTKLHCMCPFFAESSPFDTCKHLVWLSDELAYEAALEARCEEYDLALLDGVAAL